MTGRIGDSTPTLLFSELQRIATKFYDNLKLGPFPWENIRLLLTTKQEVKTTLKKNEFKEISQADIKTVWKKISTQAKVQFKEKRQQKLEDFSL